LKLRELSKKESIRKLLIKLKKKDLKLSPQKRNVLDWPKKLRRKNYDKKKLKDKNKNKKKLRDKNKSKKKLKDKNKNKKELRQKDLRKLELPRKLQRENKKKLSKLG